MSSKKHLLCINAVLTLQASAASSRARRQRFTHRSHSTRDFTITFNLFASRKKVMKINYENLPRFLVPLFLAASLTVALMSLLDLSRAISVIISLFVVVQLQKYQIIWVPSDLKLLIFKSLVGGPIFVDCSKRINWSQKTNLSPSLLTCNRAIIISKFPRPLLRQLWISDRLDTFLCDSLAKEI